MEIRNLYQPFELALLETNDYKAQRHKNTFFEMVFVLDGTGLQLINEHQLPYGPDKLFLVFPSDSHGFEVKAPSRFFFIRFNDSFLQTQNRKWVEKLTFIFRNYNHMPGCILKNTTDKPLVRSLVEALLREQANGHPHREEVMVQLIHTVISIAARNIALQLPFAGGHADQGTANLLHYIHAHIYEPDKLKITALAAHFHLAPSYMGEYFKKQAGASLQQYIGSYRLRMLEHRLQYTDMRIHEIAEELGFADESHLNRTFKKHHGLSPTSYRRQRKEAAGV
ncbi:AraC family transcriptional regulator [Taibaiella chishuiensis]|uniref:AraC family transcriptional regulator n=1 Tax=Taibaiella chishuiensis TaxID=1434707 RepID=A0A2P8D7Z5_9BACT|nr:AraC family transcriptional regulator [Taibaiella chishuiensis]PSK93332.1 AraC family transcriptional regulator [Taibaiella chishuiensis]